MWKHFITIKVEKEEFIVIIELGFEVTGIEPIKPLIPYAIQSQYPTLKGKQYTIVGHVIEHIK